MYKKTAGVSAGRFLFTRECLWTTPGGVCHAFTSRPRPYGGAPIRSVVASAFVCAALFSDGERLQDTTVPLFQAQSVRGLRMAGSMPEQAFFVKAIARRDAARC